MVTAFIDSSFMMIGLAVSLGWHSEASRCRGSAAWDN